MPYVRIETAMHETQLLKKTSSGVDNMLGLANSSSNLQ